MRKDELMKKLGTFKSVKNYDEKPNQFLIQFEYGNILQSYESIIVVRYSGKIYLGEDYDYSKTTGRYRNMFLYETLKETKAKIESGEYEMIED